MVDDVENWQYRILMLTFLFCPIYLYLSFLSYTQQRFLMGDDEYRNLRMKLMPFVVDAPSAVKMFAPAKGTQVTVKSDNVKVTWKKYNNGTCPRSGKKLSIAIEGVVDLVEKRFVRSAASLVKGNLQRLLVDCALIVSTPEKQTEEEPMACLGFFRLNRVYILDCPQMPDRYAAEAASIKVSTSLMRASTMMGLCKEDIAKLTEVY
jgi:Protein ENHANCED DISEASE RESISTANCE 2, C-terminal